MEMGSSIFDYMLYNEYMDYQNGFRFFLKSINKGAGICFDIFQKPDSIVLNLNDIKYSPKAGILDPNINQMFKHALMNIHLDYSMNALKHVTNVANVSFFNNIALSFVLTSQRATTL